MRVRFPSPAPPFLACGRRVWPGAVKLSNVLGMEGLAASVVLVAVLLGVLLVVAFDLFCLVHLAAAGRVRFLPRLAWAVVIVCISPVGGLVYLLAQSRPNQSPGSYWLFSGRA
jgi:Phospholipase_D-nuclease N-terminal